MKRFCLLLSLICSLSFNGQTQNIPISDVYTFSMKQLENGKYNFSNPKFLTNFNLDGYNNQPHFVKDNELYITVQFPDSDQTDIFSLNLDDNTITQVTATVEGEYSPTLMPTKNEFSSVRVEADGQNTQRLWKFPIDRSSRGEPAFKNITGVGYHVWVNQYKAALFVVGQPTTLILANSLTGSTIQMMDNIGRGMARLPGDNLAYIHKLDDQNWMIEEMDTYTYRSKNIIKTLPNSEDFL
ncbi:MAG: hypothetical protein AAGJ18_31460, partial [Bacteroidota bacterium]